MAILGNIRKRTTVLILIIGLALFAFVISGIFTADGGGAKIGSSVAEINGKDLSIDEFRQKVEQASRRYGANFSSTQLVNTVYDQEIRNTILNQQFEDLGIDIESDQIVEFVKTSGYAQIPDFQDENGIFNAEIFKSAIADWKVNDPLRYDAWLQDEKNIMQAAKEQLYFNLVKAGAGATLNEGEFDYNLTNNKVDVQYVRVPYSSIADSTIQVSKNEIEAYVNEHKEDYKQDKARDIRFVFFEEKPSLEDETAVKDGIVSLLDETIEYNSSTDQNDTISGFRNTADMAAFLDRNSDSKYDTIFRAKKELPAVAADSLMALKVGEIYGPYRDGDFFKMSKMMEKKPNGSVKSSHILIAYEGAERAVGVTRTKEEAEEEAKRMLTEARKPDANFANLARENSDDPTAAQRAGDIGYFMESNLGLAENYRKFLFANDLGEIGLVETPFGFHIIKIDDKEDIVKIATLSREVESSEKTVNSLFTEATKFEMASIDAEANQFSDIAKESEFTVRPVNKIKEMDENLPGLGSQRAVVQWAFNDDTKVGSIKRFDLTNGYAVVQLTKKYKEGLMASEDASATALPKIRKERKAAQIIAANKGKSLEDLASANNVTVSTASALTMKSPTIPGAGREPLVVGSAFTLEEGASSDLLKGETGVFMVKVTKKTPAAEIQNFSTYAKTLSTSNTNRVNSAVYNALKEGADIEDKRATFY
ncbi:peptidylprolyl isomerase [Croceitalea sp. MTPC9]|uniref:peptidylprolyl isomerase n=1 Tax=unclassified Croceitalea TaxID=2632280 RepID=UPI002B385277|nr:peptidylprolyl isomerase [Croceitalea sp. MTPC6]GMN17053.1 peptidylprolyl isomerase [Croceitalea sp. MTPC9]